MLISLHPVIWHCRLDRRLSIPGLSRKINKSFSSSPIIRSITYFILILSLLTGSTNSQVEVAAPSVTIELTEIVDKSTQHPIAENIISLRWETSDGEMLFFLIRI